MEKESSDSEQLQVTGDGTLDLLGRPALKSKTGGWTTSSFILGTQGFAAIGYFGVCTNLILYLTRVLGRFWTAALFLIIYTHSDDRCVQTPILYKTPVDLPQNAASLGADQFDKEDPNEQSEATKFFSWYYMSITFGAITAGLLLVYVEDNIGWGVGFGLSTAAAVSAVVAFFLGSPWYRQQRTGGNPFTRVAQVFSAAVRKHSVKVPSDSSLLYEVDVKGSAIQGSRKILHSSEFRYLDKAATETDSDTIPGTSAKNPWRLCTITQVEEVKCMIRILPIWATSILFSTLYTQMSTLFVEQGAAMDTRIAGFKVPPASLSTITMLSVLFSAPMYEYVIVPIGRKITGNKKGLTSLQRMGAGLLVVTAAMVAAAAVEIFRLRSARNHGLIATSGGSTGSHGPPAPMSVLWQIPQYFFVGASEVFTYIGQLDFFYEQSPDAIRGLSVALSPTSFALGNYVSSMLVAAVVETTSKGGRLGWIPDDLNRGHLDYYFWLLAAISVVNLAMYLACAIWYRGIQIDGDPDDAPREEP